MSQSKLVGVVETAVHGCRGFHVRLDPDCEMPKVGTHLYAAPQPTVSHAKPENQAEPNNGGACVSQPVAWWLHGTDHVEFQQHGYHDGPEWTPLYAAPKPTKREPCTWTQVDDEHTPDTWQGSCGAVWSFIEGGPADNGQRFCPKCGSECKEVRGEA